MRYSVASLLATFASLAVSQAALVDLKDVKPITTGNS
jgi:hypothetical protein